MAVRAAKGLPAVSQQGAVQGQGPHHRPSRAGKMFSAAGAQIRTAPAKPAPLGPRQHSSRVR